MSIRAKNLFISSPPFAKNGKIFSHYYFILFTARFQYKKMWDKIPLKLKENATAKLPWH
jgi:hypothetical protein